MLKHEIWAAMALICAGCGGPDLPEQGALGQGETVGGTDEALDGEALDSEALDGVLDVGEYTIHHRAVATRALAPDIRDGYGLPEAGDEILLIVSVEQRESRDSLRAAIDAEAGNLSGQRVDIGMREIHVNDMTSYIGLVEVEDREVLEFRVRVLPEGASEPIDFEFQQRFFTEPPEAAGVEEPIVAAAAPAAAAARLESLLLAEGPHACSERGDTMSGRRLPDANEDHDALHHHRGHHGIRTVQAEQSGRADPRRGADRIGT